MSRYIRKLTRLGSAGPTEERNFAIWAGYELVGVDDDLSAIGLVKVDGWAKDEIAARGVTGFLRVEPGDESTYAKLGMAKRT